MLTIILTPTMLTFKNLSDEIAEKLDLPFVYSAKGAHVHGSPDELFKILLTLSYTYDIEII